MPRVGILGLIQESNTFINSTTTLEHFQQELLLCGNEIRRKFATAHHEIRGFFDGLDRAGIEAVPVFVARALPFGTIEKGAFEALMEILFRELPRAGHLDGLLVAPHGATVVDAYPDADGEWLSRLRQAVGPEMPIIGTLDPHGNLSQRMVDATDALMAYRTNPHIDQENRGNEAADLMAATLAGKVHPVQAASFPPMAINIERQCTSESPCRDLVGRFDDVRQRPGVLSCSLMLGFPYADVAEMGTAALVVTDGKKELARRFADELGLEAWNRRHGLAGSFVSVENGVAQAARLPGPVCLLDMGDNVGGGSPADGTWIAHELIRTGIGPAFVCIDDASAVRAAESIGVGASGRLTIGARSGALNGAPLECDFTVQRIVDGHFSESEVRHGGITEYDQGRTAILTTGRLTVMVTSRRTPPFSLCQITAFGLDPQKFQILVAKGVNAPLAAYQTVCPSLLRINTPGVTVADMKQLSYQHRRKPMFPFEEATTWSP